MFCDIMPIKLERKYIMKIIPKPAWLNMMRYLIIMRAESLALPNSCAMVIKQMVASEM
jgi:hypothetical protein